MPCQKTPLPKLPSHWQVLECRGHWLVPFPPLQTLGQLYQLYPRRQGWDSEPLSTLTPWERGTSALGTFSWWRRARVLRGP